VVSAYIKCKELQFFYTPCKRNWFLLCVHSIRLPLKSYRVLNETCIIPACISIFRLRVLGSRDPEGGLSLGAHREAIRLTKSGGCLLRPPHLSVVMNRNLRSTFSGRDAASCVLSVPEPEKKILTLLGRFQRYIETYDSMSRVLALFLRVTIYQTCNEKFQQILIFFL